MAFGRKLLLSSNSTSNPTPPEAVTLEADFVVVLASLLCAIVCVLALIVVARCAYLRRGTLGWSFGIGGGDSRLANKGLKKKVLNNLPKYTHKSHGGDAADVTAEVAAEVVEVEEDCVICLAEYVDGEEIRVLPQCGHRFHVMCIDTWLGSHSSCPSCRQILGVNRCNKCGEIPVVSSGGDGGGNGGYVFDKLRPFSSAASTSSLIFLP